MVSVKYRSTESRSLDFHLINSFKMAASARGSEKNVVVFYVYPM